MLLLIQSEVRRAVGDAIQKCFNLEIGEFAIERPPNVSLGDLATPVTFELAKRLKAATGEKHNPRQLAETLKNELAALESVDRIEVAGAGYLNFFLKRPELFLKGLDFDGGSFEPTIGGKLIVEHTSVNPNKAAHIGHLRNSVLGDTLVRLLRACGETVEVQNYIDNTGVQVADVVVGFLHIEKKSLAEIAAITTKFDDYCWDLYSKVGKWYEEDKERLKLRAEALHAIEHDEGDIAEVAKHVSMRILKRHLETMWRLGITYDVMPCESEILHLHFWDRAFERLKETGAIVFETEGRNKGCWVMRAEETEPKTDEEKEAEDHDADKVLVRSNGTVNYTGKDIAYHLWKLGQLGMNFRYRKFHEYPDGQPVWISTTDEVDGDTKPIHAFGNGAAYFNVIDVGQSYAQEYVKKGVLAVTPEAERHRVARSSHLGYEKVALTPASCEELGFELSEEDRKRPFVSMSGRKGLGVKGDDLINRLETNALANVKDVQQALSEADQHDIARKIAVGALRYFLLKFNRNTVIAFDFKEALAAQGETGVYLLYSLVRVKSIFRKLHAENIEYRHARERLSESVQTLSQYFSDTIGDGIWTMVTLALRYEEVVREAAESLEPAKLAKYAFQLAQQFSTFYSVRENNIKAEADPLRQQVLIGVTMLVEKRLQAAMDVLGIPVPDKM